jgi:hypothetical protein
MMNTFRSRLLDPGFIVIYWFTLQTPLLLRRHRASSATFLCLQIHGSPNIKMDFIFKNTMDRKMANGFRPDGIQRLLIAAEVGLVLTRWRNLKSLLHGSIPLLFLEIFLTFFYFYFIFMFIPSQQWSFWCRLLYPFLSFSRFFLCILNIFSCTESFFLCR